MSGGIEYRSQPAHLVVHIEHPVFHFLFHSIFSLRLVSGPSTESYIAKSPTVLEDRYPLARGTEGENMAKGNHSFTEQDIHSRFGSIVGHTVAELAVRLDWRNERHLPDCLRGRVFHDGKAAPICQKPRTSETTKRLEDEDRRLQPMGEVGLGSVHDSLGPDRRRRYIHYISDIHIDHQLRLTGTPYAETVGRIRRKTDGLVASRRPRRPTVSTRSMPGCTRTSTVHAA